mgnify:FL=1
MDKSGRPVFNNTEGIFHFFLRQAESGGCSEEGKSCCRAKRHSENSIESFYRLQAMATGKYNGIIYGSRMSLPYLFFNTRLLWSSLNWNFWIKNAGYYVCCLLRFCRCTSNRAISAGVIPGIREACPIVAGRMLPSLMTASFFKAWTCS